MGHIALSTVPIALPPLALRPRGPDDGAPRLDSLVVSRPESHAGSRSTTVTLSLLVHGMALAAVLLVPLVMEPVLPSPDMALRAFFVTSAQLLPAPPPPPPPAPGARAKAAAAVPRPMESQAFIAPLEVPAEVKLEESLETGFAGGVEGGVPGGVPGGVVGGIIGALPEAPPPPSRVVRVGGNILAPRLLRHVPPVYPELGRQARLSARVFLEATVDEHGVVQSVRVIQTAPLFEEASVAAVKQWRYQPLLLNGQPMPFLLMVELRFNLKARE